MIQYANNSTSVTNVSKSGVEIRWTAPRTNSAALGQTTAQKTTLVRGGMPQQMEFLAGTTATLNGNEYAVHYPDNGTVKLSSNVDSYQSQLETVRHKNERLAGFWGVFILSTLAALLLVMLKYLPTKS